MENWRLVIVSAGPCGACKKFYSEQYKGLVELLKKEKVGLVEIKFESVSSKPPAGTPKEIVERYIRWFPTFIAFSADEWTAISSDLTSLNGKGIEGRVMNGTFSKDKGVSYKSSGHPMTDVGILAWLKSVASPTSSSAAVAVASSSAASEEESKSSPKTKIVPVHKSDILSFSEDKKFPTASSYSKVCSNRYVPARR